MEEAEVKEPEHKDEEPKELNDVVGEAKDEELTKEDAAEAAAELADLD